MAKDGLSFANASGSERLRDVLSGRRAADGVADTGEGGVGVLPDGGDGADAHHDNQGEHDGVLDCGRAVFTRQEFDGGLAKTCEHGQSSLGPEKEFTTRALLEQSPEKVPKDVFLGTIAHAGVNVGWAERVDHSIR